VSTSENPYGVFNFLVKFAGMAEMEFEECVLPSVTIDVVEYRQGSDEVNSVRKLPGLVKYGNLVLRRGIATTSSSLALWDWLSGFVKGSGAPTTITVVLLDRARNPVLEWSFANCWPVKYEGPILNGKNSAVAMESLEIAVEGVQLTSEQAMGQATPPLTTSA
jgi:phage tail-like protein